VCLNVDKNQDWIVKKNKPVSWYFTKATTFLSGTSINLQQVNNKRIFVNLSKTKKVYISKTKFS